MSELHGEHPGATRMKALARGLVWWPGLDGMLERVVRIVKNGGSTVIAASTAVDLANPSVEPAAH